jgi:hypothetical protein
LDVVVVVVVEVDFRVCVVRAGCDDAEYRACRARIDIAGADTEPAGEISSNILVPLGSRVLPTTRSWLGGNAVLIGPFRGVPEKTMRALAAEGPRTTSRGLLQRFRLSVSSIRY